MDRLTELRNAEASANKTLDEARSAAETATAEDFDAREAAFNDALEAAKAAKEARVRYERIEASRNDFPAPAKAEDRSFNVGTGKAKELYGPESRNSFFMDLVDRRNGDPKAAERLAQYAAEQRDMSHDSDTGGQDLMPPAFLQNLYAGVPRPGRPFADALPTYPLPATGMVVSIPRVTSGIAANVQTAGNATVTETDGVTDTVNYNVVTIAGQVDVALQMYERGGAADEIIFSELVKDYNAKLDYQLINGTGSNGQHLGIRNVSGVNTVAYTDASPTAAELLPKVYDGIQKIASNRYENATHIVWHPRRSAWAASNLSSTFPLFQVGTLVQANGQQNAGMVQTFSGLRAVNDPNVGGTYGTSTNEDEIYVVNANDLYLMEGPLRTRVLTEVGSGTLTVRLQVYGYSAFTSSRYPKSISIISGTGLVAPTF